MTAKVPSSDLTASADEQSNFRYVFSDGVSNILAGLNCTLAATTYQAGKLVLFRAQGDRVSALFRTFESAMGLAVSRDRLAIGARRAVWILQNAPEIGRELEPFGRHDACFVPHSSHITGDVRIHEMAWCAPESSANPGSPPGARHQLWFVNTRFSCLCTLHPDYSFVPRWCPPFVASLDPDDRCHLNGLAVVDGRPKYVTALGESNGPDGWRTNKAGGGIIIDVSENRIICRGLSMPHSPRVHDGRLWVLNSGAGELQTVDPEDCTRHTVLALPGYARGLAFAGHYAFVGLSKIRETSIFGGLPIAQRVSELECGIHVVDLRSATSVGFLKFLSGCDEIFDVQILSGCRWPAVIGLEKDTLNGVFILPSRSQRDFRNMAGGGFEPPISGL